MKLIDRILGRSLASSESSDQKIGVLMGVPLLGLDGLSSAAYGPEAALTILLPLGILGPAYGLPVTLVIVGLLTILYLSYRQTLAAYPNGGGSYTVARENLGPGAGLVAAAALMLDYVLTVAVGISAGVGALVSAMPSLQPQTLPLCLGILALVTIVNLRGAKESGVAFAFPTYLFIVSLILVLIIGAVHVMSGGAHPIHAPALLRPGKAIGGLTLTWLLLRAFASGCTAMTGVEAVSNGIGAFAEPRIKKAEGTLTAICTVLAVLLLGIAWLCRAYGIGATDPNLPGYQSVISQLIAAVVGRGAFYYVTIASVLVVLALSANTGFSGFPRLCRLVALDNYLPHSFRIRGRRLVYASGIVILASLSALLLIAFGGVTDRLIPLFAIGAFLAFTLSQYGMVRHWAKIGTSASRLPLIINFAGCMATAVALVVIAVAKFTEGAWITFLIIPGLVILFKKIETHYEEVRNDIKLEKPLDVSDTRPPIVIVPINSWTKIAERGLLFALRISPTIVVVHVEDDEEVRCELEARWDEFVVSPITMAGLSQPKFVILPSPYRRLFGPLFGYIMEVRERNPGRQIAVIIPELQERSWYQWPLHNQRAAALKAQLLLRGDKRIAVINVAWYLSKDEKHQSEPPPWIR